MKTVEVVNVQKDEEYTRVLFKGAGDNGLAITLVFEYDREIPNPPEVGEKWELSLYGLSEEDIVEAARLKIVAQQEAKQLTYNTLKHYGMAVPPDLKDEIENR